MRTLLLCVATLALLLGCDSGAPDDAAPESPSDDEGGQQYPDVVDADLTATEGGWEIEVTISSPYDSPDRYANGWRVLTPDGEVITEHDLAHHHADEQPFTRTRGPFWIPEGVDEVVVEGRDSEHGYGGDTATTSVPMQ